MVLRLALPIQVTGTGSLAAIAQDSPGEIARSVALLVSTRPGERRSVPDYGTPDPLFGGINADELADAIALWEERADPATIDQLSEGIVEAARIYPTAAPDLVTDTTEEA